MIESLKFQYVLVNLPPVFVLEDFCKSLLTSQDLIFFSYHRFMFMKKKNPFKYSQYFRTWLHTRLVLTKFMWINFCELFLLIVWYDCCICVFYIFPLILRGISTGYKRLSRKMTLRMLPIFSKWVCTFPSSERRSR